MRVWFGAARIHAENKTKRGDGGKRPKTVAHVRKTNTTTLSQIPEKRLAK